MVSFRTLPWRRAGYAVSSFLIAFTSGHFLQSWHGDPPLPSEVAVAVPQLLPPPDVTLARFSPEDAAGAPTVAMATVRPIAPDAASLPTGFCSRRASVAPGLSGMVRIHLAAPCDAGLRIAVAQGPLQADWRLDETGERFLSFTPMMDVQPIRVTWPDGAVEDFRVPVLPLARAALIWDGPQFLALYAQTPARPVERGFLTVLGDGSGRMAEVFTPARPDSAESVVVSAAVTLRSCGRQATAAALEADGLGSVRVAPIDIAIPDCAAAGQTLRLKNLFGGLKLAER